MRERPGGLTTAPLATTDGTPRLVLVGFAGDLAVAHELPEEGRVTLGRGAEADVVVDHPSVSRVHAAVHVGPTGRCLVEDLGSRNGTRLRGADVRDKLAELRPGDALQVGAATLVLQERRDGQRAWAPGGGAVRPRAPVEMVVGSAMRELMELADRVAPGEINVLILGETGVGKERLAEHLHQRSRRRDKPLVRIHCAALAESLFESELFGHERGAFTGAIAAKPGLLETAEGGTVFLDEIGEVPAPVQVKLLRAIDERKVQRVGSVTTRSVDVRFLAATHRDLGSEVNGGQFRQDLYYRLAGVTLRIPPLRERKDELAALAASFAGDAAERIGRPRPALSPSARAALEAHEWPGNIRELRNVVERAVLLAGDAPAIDEAHLHMAEEVTARPSLAPPAPAPQSSTGVQLREELDALERERILGALERCAGNQTRAAETLGIPRSTLLKRLDSLGIKRPRKGR
jgi:two-component system, NtrC family, response regulator AtoC